MRMMPTTCGAIDCQCHGGHHDSGTYGGSADDPSVALRTSSHRQQSESRQLHAPFTPIYSSGELIPYVTDGVLVSSATETTDTKSDSCWSGVRKQARRTRTMIRNWTRRMQVLAIALWPWEGVPFSRPDAKAFPDVMSYGIRIGKMVRLCMQYVRIPYKAHWLKRRVRNVLLRYCGLSGGMKILHDLQATAEFRLTEHVALCLSYAGPMPCSDLVELCEAAVVKRKTTAIAVWGSLEFWKSMVVPEALLPSILTRLLGVHGKPISEQSRTTDASIIVPKTLVNRYPYVRPAACCIVQSFQFWLQPAPGMYRSRALFVWPENLLMQTYAAPTPSGKDSFPLCSTVALMMRLNSVVLLSTMNSMAGGVLFRGARSAVDQHIQAQMLHTGIRYGSIHAVQYLVRYGVQLREPVLAHSALQAAAFSQQISMLRLLIAPESASWFGPTESARKTQPEWKEWLRSAAVESVRGRRPRAVKLLARCMQQQNGSFSQSADRATWSERLLLALCDESTENEGLRVHLDATTDMRLAKLIKLMHQYQWLNMKAIASIQVPDLCLDDVAFAFPSVDGRDGNLLGRPIRRLPTYRILSRNDMRAPIQMRIPANVQAAGATATATRTLHHLTISLPRNPRTAHLLMWLAGRNAVQAVQALHTCFGVCVKDRDQDQEGENFSLEAWSLSDPVYTALALASTFECKRVLSRKEFGVTRVDLCHALVYAFACPFRDPDHVLKWVLDIDFTAKEMADAIQQAAIELERRMSSDNSAEVCGMLIAVPRLTSTPPDHARSVRQVVAKWPDELRAVFRRTQRWERRPMPREKRPYELYPEDPQSNQELANRLKADWEFWHQYIFAMICKWLEMKERQDKNESNVINRVHSYACNTL